MNGYLISATNYSFVDSRTGRDVKGGKAVIVIPNYKHEGNDKGFEKMDVAADYDFVELLTEKDFDLSRTRDFIVQYKANFKGDVKILITGFKKGS